MSRISDMAYYAFSYQSLGWGWFSQEFINFGIQLRYIQQSNVVPAQRAIPGYIIGFWYAFYVVRRRKRPPVVQKRAFGFSIGDGGTTGSCSISAILTPSFIRQLTLAQWNSQ